MKTFESYAKCNSACSVGSLSRGDLVYIERHGEIVLILDAPTKEILTNERGVRFYIVKSDDHPIDAGSILHMGVL